jgi:hypothetical protein
MSTELSAAHAEIDVLRFYLRKCVDTMNYIDAENTRLRAELAAAQALLCEVLYQWEPGGFWFCSLCGGVDGNHDKSCVMPEIPLSEWLEKRRDRDGH